MRAAILRASSVGLEPQCMNDTAVELYLNRRDVQRALHVDAFAGQWTMCSDAVSAAYVRQYSTMHEQVVDAVEHGVRVLLYYGDADMACNFLLGQRFAQQLQLQLVGPKRAWMHMKQVAGFVTQYEGLDFVTIKVKSLQCLTDVFNLQGAGHMAPQWRAAQAFHMMYRYINNQPY